MTLGQVAHPVNRVAFLTEPGSGRLHPSPQKRLCVCGGGSPCAKFPLENVWGAKRSPVRGATLDSGSSSEEAPCCPLELERPLVPSLIAAGITRGNCVSCFGGWAPVQKSSWGLPLYLLGQKGNEVGRGRVEPPHPPRKAQSPLITALESMCGFLLWVRSLRVFPLLLHK